MTDTPTRQEWEAAQLACERARQAAKSPTTIPQYGSGRKADALREAWAMGYGRVDQQRRLGA